MFFKRGKWYPPPPPGSSILSRHVVKEKMMLLSVPKQSVWVSKSRSVFLNHETSASLLQHAQSLINSSCHSLLWWLKSLSSPVVYSVPLTKAATCRKDVSFTSLAFLKHGYTVTRIFLVFCAVKGQTSPGLRLHYSSEIV